MRSSFRHSLRLRGIERELRRSSPHLAAMLQIFSRLNAGVAIPSRKQPRRRNTWVRRLAALLAGALSGLAVAAGWVSGQAVRLCGRTRRLVSRTARVSLGASSAAPGRAGARNSLGS